MTGAGVKALAAAALAAGGLAAGGSDAALSSLEAGRVPGHHLLYLPNGRYLRAASLGHASIVADVLYLWSIQYYSNFQAAERYRYVEHIYADVITELDPHYFDPYWIGALVLTVEAGQREKGLALLEKGFRNNPDRWIYLYLAGWECAYAKEFDRAVDYFRRAAAVPGVPPDVGRLVAGMYQKSGDPSTALREWQKIAASSEDPGVRKIAETRVRSLAIEADIAALRAALDAFRAERGAWPRRLEDLAGASLVRAVPFDPDGAPYAYDPRTGAVGTGDRGVIPR